VALGQFCRDLGQLDAALAHRPDVGDDRLFGLVGHQRCPVVGQVEAVRHRSGPLAVRALVRQCRYMWWAEARLAVLYLGWSMNCQRTFGPEYP
jgi:hypothetical protein